MFQVWHIIVIVMLGCIDIHGTVKPACAILGLTKEARNERSMNLINWGNLINTEASPLLNRAAHHAESDAHQRAWNWNLLLLHQLQHELSQLGKRAVHNLSKTIHKCTLYLQLNEAPDMNVQHVKQYNASSATSCDVPAILAVCNGDYQPKPINEPMKECVSE